MYVKGMGDGRLIHQFPDFRVVERNPMVNNLHIEVLIIDHKGSLNGSWPHVLRHKCERARGISL